MVRKTDRVIANTLSTNRLFYRAFKSGQCPCSSPSTVTPARQYRTPSDGESGSAASELLPSECSLIPRRSSFCTIRDPPRRARRGQRAFKHAEDSRDARLTTRSLGRQHILCAPAAPGRGKGAQHEARTAGPQDRRSEDTGGFWPGCRCLRGCQQRRSQRCQSS
jgi:hypothetical protein